MHVKRCLATVLAILLSLHAKAALATEVDAVTTAYLDLKLAFTVDRGGKVDGEPVKPGTVVKKDQVLIQLDDREGEARLAYARILAGSDVEVKAAEAKLGMTLVEQKRAHDLVAKNAISNYEVEKADVAVTIDKLALELKQQEHKAAQEQLRLAEAAHDKCFLRAPYDGVVETVLVRRGETVEALKPVLRMVATNPLWIEAAAPTSETLKAKVGDPAWVTYKLEGYRTPIQGKIIFVANVADAASETRLVRVEMENQAQLPAGSHVTVSLIQPKGATAAKTEKD